MIIKTKQQYFKLAQQGLAGNSARSWDSPEDFLRESNAEIAGIRIKDPGSKKFRAVISRNEIIASVRKLNLLPGEYIVSESLAAEDVTFQAELGFVNGKWVLHCSTQKAHQRKALSESGQHISGRLAVWGLLRHYCTPADTEDMERLFELYTVKEQYPVIELSATTRSVGIFPNRNTFIWEIRHY